MVLLQMNKQFDIGDISAGKYFFGIASFLGLLFLSIGPEMEGVSFIVLFLIWQIQTVGAIGVVIAVHILLVRYSVINKVNYWGQLLLSGVVGATLFAPIALIVDIYLGKEGFPDNLIAEALDEWLAVAIPVTLTWLILNAPWFLGYRVTDTKKGLNNSKPDQQAPQNTDALSVSVTRENQSESLPQINAANTNGFWSLVPDNLGSNIIYLESELHYLKVVTAKGPALILYSLREAANELGEDIGTICHRSFWVAKSHIQTFKKNGRQGQLILQNGDVIPVSRSNVDIIKSSLS